jgi:hypothetical protein
LEIIDSKRQLLDKLQYPCLMFHEAIGLSGATDQGSALKTCDRHEISMPAQAVLLTCPISGVNNAEIGGKGRC